MEPLGCRETELQCKVAVSIAVHVVVHVESCDFTLVQMNSVTPGKPPDPL